MFLLFHFCFFLLFVFFSADGRSFFRANNRIFDGFVKNSSIKFEEFHFIHATDTQFGLIEFFKNGKQDVWQTERETLEKAIEQWNDLKPKFVAVTGDLVNAFPVNETEELRKKQMDSLLKEFDKLNENIALIMLPGNHDILDKPTTKAVDEYKKQFGDDYFSFWINNVMFIVVNSQYFMDPNFNKGAYDQQNQWLDEQLKDAKSSNYSHVIVLQHVPLFIGHINNDNPKNQWAIIPKVEATKLLNRFESSGVRYVFSGHYHQNSEGRFGNISMIVTSAIGWQSSNTTRAGYRHVHVKLNNLEYLYRNVF